MKTYASSLHPVDCRCRRCLPPHPTDRRWANGIIAMALRGIAARLRWRA